MAGPHLPQKQSSTELTKFQEKAAELFSKGLRPAEIAKLRYPGTSDEEKKRRKYLRKKLWRALRSDPFVRQRIGEIAQGELALAVAPASKRIGKRAARLGKSPDVKLVYEASGFHNPRVKHEHSGDIKVTLDIPRPAKVESELDDAIDAEVVDE